MSDLEFMLDAVAADGEAYFTAGGQRYVCRYSEKRLETIGELQHRLHARHACGVSAPGMCFASEGEAIQFATVVAQYQQLLVYAVGATRATGEFLSDRLTRDMYRGIFSTLQAHLRDQRMPLLRTICGVNIDYLSMAPEEICARLDEVAMRAHA